MSAPKWSVGMQRLGPGMYVGKDGKSLHCDAVPAANFETILNERNKRA